LRGERTIAALTRSSFGLAALALAAFSFLTSEMLPIGLLPRIAASFGVSLPVAGLLLTAYAFVVTLVGPPLTAVLGDVSRKRLFLTLAAVLALSAAVAALAPAYWILLAARLVNALAHGVFWSIVASAASSLVAPGRRGLAVAAVYSGSSLGIILGVPIGTFAGERFGWQAGFWFVAALGTVAFVALCAADDIPAPRPSSLGDIGSLLREMPFLRLLLSTTLVVIGHFTAFSYFAPLLMRDEAGRAGGVPLLLLIFGIAGFASNFVFGSLAHRRGVVAISLSAALMAAALVALGFDRHWTAFGTPELVALVALWGAGTGGAVVALQTRVLAAQPERQDVASALNSSAFNLGIGGGALVGGLVIRMAGLGALPAVAALLIVPALALQIVPAARARFAAARI
jgi:predicted MFS family arabinose efflux permease